MIGVLLGAALLAGAAIGWPAALVAAALAGAWALARAAPRAELMLCASIVAAAAFGAVRQQPIPNLAPPGWVDDAKAVRGAVVTAPDRGSRSQTFVLLVAEADTGDEWQADGVTRLCVVAGPEPRAGLGDRVWLPGSASALADEPSRYRALLRQRGCGATYFTRQVAVDRRGSGPARRMADARDAVSDAMQSLAPGDVGALMSGLVSGDDRALSRPRQDAFLATSTSHITAVSGSNFAAFATVLLVAGRRAGWRRHWPWLVIVCGAIWVYALFVGLNPPALRAALTATAVALAVRAGRRPDLVTLTVLAGAVMVAVDPMLIWSLSFRLSFVSALMLATLISPSGDDRPWLWVSGVAAATMAAQAATLPFLLPINERISLSGLPANIIIGPLVTIAFPASAAAGGGAMLWRPLGEALAVPARLSCTAIIGVVDWLAGWRGGVLPVGEATPPTLALVSLFALAACVAVSRDGRRL
ncbi:MAG: ComEC/Rec2 family competence protein, partial [Thermomicrobiales bacterium]|nr:ComEC/Rec2 family competence protein [Thermomicrobiales bacterium]